MASKAPTQVMRMTRRYGNTVYTVNAFCSESSGYTFEEKLLELIRDTSSDQTTATNRTKEHNTAESIAAVG